MFALTANFAFAKSNSISTVNIDNNAFANKDSIAIDNPYFKVVRNGAQFSSSNTPNIGSRIIAALENIKFKSSRGKIKIKRGEIAVFNENEFYEIPTGSYFEIALKKDHPQLAKPSEWVEPTKNKIIYEDNEFRVFEERLNPGDIRELQETINELKEQPSDDSSTISYVAIVLGVIGIALGAASFAKKK